MDNVLNRIIKLVALSVVIILTISFSLFYDDIRNSKDVLNTDELSGLRIGVMSGWESDYFLSSRDDLSLKRYDTSADLLMALNYKQVDAIAIDSSLYALCQNSISNIDRIGEPLHSFYYTYYTYKDSEILKKMNEFIEIYNQTDEYKEFAEKAFNLDWITSDDYTPETGAGDVIKVGYVVDYYPCIFIDEKGDIKGPEKEYLVRFANYYNYKIEWHEVTESTFMLETKLKKIDIASTAATDLYRSELDSGVSYLGMSDGYLLAQINLVKVNGKMKINNSDLFDAY